MPSLASLILAAGLTLLADPAAAATYPDPGRVTGQVTGVHDPSMVRAATGSYLLVSTGVNLPIRMSTDRISFTRSGVVWPNGAPWTDPFTAGNRNNLWAPDLSFHNGRYYLYYSASSFGSNNSAIFLATSPTGNPGSWTDLGIVVRTSSTDDHNAIDPNLVVDSAGRWWLTFGSFWTGIKMIRIDPATGMGHPGDRTRYDLARRPTASGAIEAPFIVERAGLFYLFVSFDLCCRGTASTYRIMVGRSASITGPYTDRAGVRMNNGGGTEIMATHGSVTGPGHQAVLQDTDRWLLIYHYYSSSAPGGRLGINFLDWDGGWPVAV